MCTRENVAGFITDLPLVCDDLLARELSNASVDAIVLSENLLDLWHVKPLINLDTTDTTALLSNHRNRVSDGWDVDNGVLTKRFDYLIDVRLSVCPNEAEINAVCINPIGESNQIEPLRYSRDSSVGVIKSKSQTEKLANATVCRSSKSIRILPQKMVEAFLAENSKSIVLFFDAFEQYQQNSLRFLPNVLFAFTTPPPITCDFTTNDCESVSTASRLRFNSTELSRFAGDSWFFYIDNECLLDTDNLFRFRTYLDDPNDALFWRNLLAQLLRLRNEASSSTSKKSAERAKKGTAILIDVGWVSRQQWDDKRALSVLRVKRFLCFFSRLIIALSERGIKTLPFASASPIRDGEILLCWTANRSNDEWSCFHGCSNLVQEALATIVDEAVRSNTWKILRNVDCYLRPTFRDNLSSIKNEEKNDERDGSCDSNDPFINRCKLVQFRHIGCNSASSQSARRKNCAESPCDLTLRPCKRVKSEGDRRQEGAVESSRSLNIDIHGDNIVGLFDGSLLVLDSEVSFPRLPSSFAYICADGRTLLNRHVSGAPIFKVSRGRFL